MLAAANVVHRSNTSTHNNYSKQKQSTPNTSRTFSADRNTSDSSKGKRPICQICDKPGHSAHECYNRGNKDRYPPRRGQQRSVNLVSTAPSDLVDPS